VKRCDSGLNRRGRRDVTVASIGAAEEAVASIGMTEEASCSLGDRTLHISSTAYQRGDLLEQRGSTGFD
jgi:hypothetical protein